MADVDLTKIDFAKLNNEFNPDNLKRVRVTIEVLDHYLVGGGSAKSDEVVIEMSRHWDGTDKDRADFCRFLADHVFCEDKGTPVSFDEEL